MERTAKQVIVMRKDLGMRKGKMIAQGAHASMKVLLQAGSLDDTREHFTRRRRCHHGWTESALRVKPAAMRSKHLIVPVLLALAACKGKSDSKSSSTDQPALRESKTVTPAPQLPEQPPAEALPSDFPLPASSKKQLVRSHKRLTMLVWEYELRDVAAKDAAKQIEDGMRAAAWTIVRSDASHTMATSGGRMYVVGVEPVREGSKVVIRSFPEAGPSTLNAPTTYPSKFPFLAGGTASQAPDGAKLTIAYQSDARDIELAMMIAAEAAGWTCTGVGTVTCTKDKSNVTFTTEQVRGGALLVVSAR